MAKLVPHQQDATFFLVEGYIGDVKLRFMQSYDDVRLGIIWLVGEQGQTPQVFEDIMEAKAQWHFLIDLYVMKLMVDAERKEKSDGQQ